LLKPFVRTLRVGQFVVAVCVFTYVALMPASMLQTQQADVKLHFVGNLLLFLSAWLACYGRFNIWMLLALLVPYSILVELAQWLAPSRMVDDRDMMANILGLLTGLVIAFIADRTLIRLPKVRSYLTKHRINES
jgi:glycopeptide antibiotics resistance protein